MRGALSRTQRLALLAGALALVVVGFGVVRGGGSGGDAGTVSPRPPATRAVATVEVRNARPFGGPRVLRFKRGDTIRFRVHSDVADEVHLHGYDRHRDVRRGGTVSFAVPATIEGRFEVELEGRARQIAAIEVVP